MFNPPDSYPNPGSYLDLKKRMIQHMQQAKVDDRMIEIVQMACENELDKQHIVLSSLEKELLLRQVIQAVLTDILVKLDSPE
jgi:hypothetical protein